MRLFSLSAWTSFLAIQQSALICAWPTHKHLALERAHDYNEIDKRAPDGIEVPLVSVARNTWQGHRVHPGLFGSSMSNDQLKASAEKTYNGVIGSVPWAVTTLLVSIIYVPRRGLAAGTIWAGADEMFEGSARQLAPNFWAAVPGPSQNRIPGSNNVNKWHSEAVAAQKAESVFGSEIRNGRWPVGTKIYTYGKVSGGPVGPKASCSLDRSSVLVPCSEWTTRLGLQII